MSIYDFEDRLAARHHRAQLGCLTAGVLAGGILGGLILGLGQLCLEHFAQKRHERREQRAENAAKRVREDACGRTRENAKEKVLDPLNAEPDGALVEGAPAIEGEASDGHPADSAVTRPGGRAFGELRVEEFGGEGRIGTAEDHGLTFPVDAP